MKKTMLLKSMMATVLILGGFNQAFAKAQAPAKKPAPPKTDSLVCNAGNGTGVRVSYDFETKTVTAVNLVFGQESRPYPGRSYQVYPIEQALEDRLLRFMASQSRADLSQVKTAVVFEIDGSLMIAKFMNAKGKMLGASGLRDQFAGFTCYQ